MRFSSKRVFSGRPGNRTGAGSSGMFFPSRLFPGGMPFRRLIQAWVSDCRPGGPGLSARVLVSFGKAARADSRPPGRGRSGAAPLQDRPFRRGLCQHTGVAARKARALSEPSRRRLRFRAPRNLRAQDAGGDPGRALSLPGIAHDVQSSAAVSFGGGCPGRWRRPRRLPGRLRRPDRCHRRRDCGSHFWLWNGRIRWRRERHSSMWQQLQGGRAFR